MSIFLVQVDQNNIPITDVGFTLIQACNFQNWYFGESAHLVYLISENIEFLSCKELNLILEKTINNNPAIGQRNNTENKKIISELIPVGSLGFVEKIIGKTIEPINVPESLLLPKFLNREYFKISKGRCSEEISTLINEKFPKEKELFVKSTEHCKGYIRDMIKKEKIAKIKELQNLGFIISEVVEITAEWRVFVLKNEIQDIKSYYMESFVDVPNISFIQEAISTLKASNSNLEAYTLDVAKLKNGKMAVMEVHNFISVGLYGFEDYKVLPKMIKTGYLSENKGVS